MLFSFIIEEVHPVLSGHFPDNPVVPGVVILDQVINCWNKRYKKKIIAIPHAKFMHVLKPGIECNINFQAVENSTSNKVAFTITSVENVIICKGMIEYV